MFRALALMLCAVLALPVFASQGDRLVGRWLTEDDDATIEIMRDGGSYAGRIVAMKKPLYPEGHESGLGGQPKVDRNNPDPDKRGQPLVGLPLLRGFVWAGGDLWSGGTIYNPRDGADYRCEITLNDDGTLGVRGYVLLPLLGQTQTWRPAP